MIDLNCDMGEGLNNEHLLMPYLTSCNISCGAHAGSVEIMDNVINLAKQHTVKIGAHPSFEDRQNFGRVVLNITHEELFESLVSQLELFQQRLTLHNATIHHVKPHGALYNLIAVNREKAAIVIKAIQHVFEEVTLFAPFHSEIAKLAKIENIEVVFEAFADRNYNDDLTLVSRKEAKACLTRPDEVVTHVSRMLRFRRVRTITGKETSIQAETFCIHGDNPNVQNILKRLHQEFQLK